MTALAGPPRPIRVVVVEDSLVQRALIVRALEADGDVRVVGQAGDTDEAVAQVAQLRPDVVTLDLHIPGGGGQAALEQIMAETPTPILVLSAMVASRDSTPAIEALVGGALDAIPKPARWGPDDEADLRRRVRALRGVTVVRHHRARLKARRAAVDRGRGGRCLVAVAASTGGPPALAQMLSGMAGVQAAVLVVQHIHPDFVDGLVTWMQRVAPMPVVLATERDPIKSGVVYIAPGGAHLRVSPELEVVLGASPSSTHRPSADELFFSVAEHAGRSAVGVVLTGMGDDGAKGLLAIKERGGQTLAQDAATSAVFGMPRAAAESGAAQRVLPLADLAAAILVACAGRGARP